MSRPPPPTDFPCWLDYAIATIDARGAQLDRIFSENDIPSQDDIRAAAQEELDELKQKVAMPWKSISPEHRALLERLARRDAEVMRLRAENQRLTEQFVVWIYNAHIRGVSLSDLERPLPPVDRGQTRRGLRAVEGGK